MTITSKLNKSQYIKAGLIGMFNNLLLRIIYSFFVILFLFVIYAKLKYPELEIPIVGIVLPVFFLPVLYILIFAKSYSQNQDLHDEIIFEFNQDFIHVKGTNNSSRIALSTIYKIKETRNWIFIYQTKQMFFPIWKKQLNEEQIAYLRNIKR